MKTYFASAERSDDDVVFKEHTLVDSVEYAQQIMNAMPCLSVILNSNRQIIYANDTLLSLLDLDEMSDTLGLRPGELVSCIHSCTMPGGCGTSQACQQCGAVNTILNCLQSHNPENGECRITSAIDGQLISFEFKVTCSPFILDDDFFIIMTLTDISGEKRKQLLERTFLHDLTNKTSSLHGLAHMIKKVDAQGRLGKLTDILNMISSTINDEIVSYRQLVSAENNLLAMNITTVNAYEMVDIAIHSTRYHEVSQGKEILPVPPFPDVQLTTETTLLQRILLNMLKNALEATNPFGVVKIGYTLSNDMISFFVHNESVIPDFIKNQIFQRSFSTKEEGRGIGTYSMKLLGEKYLKGKVRFESSPENGTFFYVTLPLVIKN